MAFHWIPHPDDWGVALHTHKLKNDNGLRKAFAELWRLDTDEYDKRLAQLPRLLKLATDFKKSKEVIAAGPGAVKMVAELIDVIGQARKQIEKHKKEFEQNGARPVDVQFIVVDWNGKAFSDGTGYATFESPGVPTVKKVGALSSSGFSINDVRLRPSGTVSLMVTSGTDITVDGVVPYEFKPGTPIIKFKAIQHSRKHKTRAKSIDDVTRKFGFKGSVGVDFKVLKVGGEVTEEDAYRHAYENEVEWELEGGLPTFKDFKQL